MSNIQIMQQGAMTPSTHHLGINPFLFTLKTFHAWPKRDKKKLSSTHPSESGKLWRSKELERRVRRRGTLSLSTVSLSWNSYTVENKPSFHSENQVKLWDRESQALASTYTFIKSYCLHHHFNNIPPVHSQETEKLGQ